MLHLELIENHMPPSLDELTPEQLVGAAEEAEADDTCRPDVTV